MYYHLYLDIINDPSINLAYEESLLNQLGSGDALFLLYRNSDSVIIGKNQNPWLEANIPWLEAENIPLVRCISGGGTVWHDPGNLNYSFMGDRSLICKENNLAFICQSLQQFGLDIQANSRGDLLIDGLKCSGNALCYRKSLLLHHGTILINANLDKLHTALDSKWRSAFDILSTTVPSVKSSVCQLQTYRTELTSNEVATTLLRAWQTAHQSLPWPKIIDVSQANASELISKYRNRQWNYERTPDFQFKYQDNLIDLKQGKYQDKPFNQYLQELRLF